VWARIATGKAGGCEVTVFAALCKSFGIPAPVPEYRFHPTRKWRADYAWPAAKIILEVEGGVWTKGRHTRGAGFLKDCEKYNAAALLGYRVLRVTPKTLESTETMDMLREALK
jgi:hypothetical protein